MPEFGPFRGLHRRDNVQLVPSHYLWEAENIDFKGRQTQLRPKFEQGSTTDALIKLFDFSRTNVSSDVSTNLLGLTASDAVDNPTRFRDLTRDVDLVNDDVTNFFAVDYLHRAFILTRNVNTLANLHYYDGLNYIEAGLAPDDTTLDLTITSANSGKVFTGNYHIGYVLETDTGYFSIPYRLSDYVDNSTFGSLVPISGNKAIRVAADFTGLPAHVKRIHFISTSNIPDDVITYPADSFNYYFIPGGTLNRVNNDFPGTIDLDYFPPQLFSSVDYLFRQHETIKGGDGLAFYNNRLCVWGGTELTDQSILRVSRVNQPESFSKVDGFVVVAPEINSSITNVFEFRGTLYITKENSTYVVADNGSEPATWPVVTVDKGLGAGANGVSSILASQGTSLDFVAISTKGGLTAFDGIYRRPEISWNIENLWTTSKSIVRDPSEKKIYCLVGNDIYVCNYVEGRGRDYLRWSKWTFGNLAINHLIIDSNGKLNLATDKGVYCLADDADEAVSATLLTGALGGGANAAMHFGDILVNKSLGAMNIQAIGRQEGNQEVQALADGDGVYRAQYAFTDDSIQVKLTAEGKFELETINPTITRLWDVPIDG